MRNYQIYLIEDEFAMHYYGREKLFFNLFLEYINSKGYHKSILQKQIEYVTKDIPFSKLSMALAERRNPTHDHVSENEVYYTETKNGTSKAALVIGKDYLHLKSEGTYEAETEFFESIRKCESGFLALDFENKHFGWLKPIKERKFV